MSSIEIREAVGDEHTALTTYAFAPSPQPRQRTRGAASGEATDAPDREARVSPRDRETVRLVAADSETVLATAGGIRMQQNVRGSVLPMLGIGAVAAAPQARRHGHVRALLDQLHDRFAAEGYATATLWPFRPSFYDRFGYVNFPHDRSIRLLPTGMGPLRKLDLPGEVTLHRWDENAEEIAAYLQKYRQHRHGMALDGQQALIDVQEDAWVAVARRDAAVVGMLIYRTDGIGQALQGRTLLCDDPAARLLLLRWLALHDDQFEAFRFTVPPGETPELWYPDAEYDDETTVRLRGSAAPMGRVLSVPALSGIAVGEASVTVRVVDDRHLAGTWMLDGTGGILTVSAKADVDAADDVDRITGQGLSALVFGTLRAEDLPLHAYGTVGPPTAQALNTLFRPASPFLYAQF